MGETEPGPALASYRDRITELIEAGEPFAVVGDTTDDSAGPIADESPRWLLAPSMARSSRAAARRARRSGRPRLTGRGIATQAQRRTWRDAGEAAPNERRVEALGAPSLKSYGGPPAPTDRDRWSRCGRLSDPPTHDELRAAGRAPAR